MTNGFKVIYVTFYIGQCIHLANIAPSFANLNHGPKSTAFFLRSSQTSAAQYAHALSLLSGLIWQTRDCSCKGLVRTYFRYEDESVSVTYCLLLFLKYRNQSVYRLYRTGTSLCLAHEQFSAGPCSLSDTILPCNCELFRMSMLLFKQVTVNSLKTETLACPY